MKWPADQTKIMLDGFKQFIDSYGYSIQQIKDDNPNVMATIWKIQNQVVYDLRFDDNHPAYTQHGRQRRVKYNPAFVLYPPGCHDLHMTTMLRYIGKELGLL